MFRKSLFLSVTLMALFYLATNPSMLLAQGRGRTNMRAVTPMTTPMSRFNSVVNPRTMNPRFDRFSPSFDRRLDQRLLNSRFDRLSPLDRRFLDPRLNMLNPTINQFDRRFLDPRLNMLSPTIDQLLLERRFAGF